MASSIPIKVIGQVNCYRAIPSALLLDEYIKVQQVSNIFFCQAIICDLRGRTRPSLGNLLQQIDLCHLVYRNIRIFIDHSAINVLVESVSIVVRVEGQVVVRRLMAHYIVR